MNAPARALSCFAALAGAAVLLAADAPAGDWPQWRGPNRDGVSTETGLLKTWPADGPKQIQKITGIGGGYSTVAVVGGRIYTTGAKGMPPGKGGGGKGGGGFGKGGFGGGGPSHTESLVCIDARTGKELWATKIGKTSGAFAGPRSTPAVSGGRVYAMSSDGNLVCVNAEKGDVVWKKDLKSDYGGEAGMFAYSESVLIDGGRVVVTPGGSRATILALNKDTGKDALRAPVTGLTSTGGKGKGGFGGGGFGKGGGGFGKGKGGGYSSAAYSSVVAADIAGEKTYVQFLSGGVVGVSAKTGKLLWNYDAPSCGMANASTPIVKGDAVFAASGYSNGGGRADVTKGETGMKAKEKYFLKSMQNQHGGMVLVDGHVYGTSETHFMCVNFDSGEVTKSVRVSAKGSVVAADGMIYFRSERGAVHLLEADPKTLTEKGRFTPKDKSGDSTWAVPVIAGGKLYLRDWDTLLIYDVKAEKTEK